MAATRQNIGPSIRRIYHSLKEDPRTRYHVVSRSFTSVPARYAEEVAQDQSSSQASLDPSLIAKPPAENPLIKPVTMPIGSRRRRAALRSTANIPFEQLPYQCFQEARKILRADREDKLQQIEVQRARMAKLQTQEPATRAEQLQKQNRLSSMQKRLEVLKILADINDPVIKKRFEDGEGDMNRPIYRFLANKQWRSYRRPVMVQRLTQMAVVPDVLSHLDPTADVRMGFRRRNVQPGDFVDSRISEIPPKFRVQVFDKGERLISVAVVDPDVPDLERDSFYHRCHYFAANIPISPSSTSVPLSRLSKESQEMLPWLPPHAHLGSPYHRLVVIILQQPAGQVLDTASLREKIQRDGFNLRSYQQRLSLKPIGAFLFRTQWDEGTADVMQRAGLPGADLHFKRKRVEPLKKKQEPLKLKRNRLGLAGLPTKRLKF